jgi:hypothetical protein
VRLCSVAVVSVASRVLTRSPTFAAMITQGTGTRTDRGSNETWLRAVVRSVRVDRRTCSCATVDVVFLGSTGESTEITSSVIWGPLWRPPKSTVSPPSRIRSKCSLRLSSENAVPTIRRSSLSGLPAFFPSSPTILSRSGPPSTSPAGLTPSALALRARSAGSVNPSPGCSGEPLSDPDSLSISFVRPGSMRSGPDASSR